MTKAIIGWDIGGAHVKAARLTPDGNVQKLALLPCPLWKGMNYLEQAVTQIQNDLAGSQCEHAMTMTGELVDYFDNRQQGVEAIIQRMQALLPEARLAIYAGKQGFLAPEAITESQILNIASANWLASTDFVARKVGDGVFVDIGSTTTDVLLFEHGQLNTQGYTDYQRLLSREMVYTGIVRTPVIAVAQEVMFQQQSLPLMAEFFASMADVYRLTGDLNEAHDVADTADGAEKTVLASARRLSRMTGYEFDASDLALWKTFAYAIKSQQKTKISQAITQQARRGQHEALTLVGAGIGRFLVRELASEMGASTVDFDELIESEQGNQALTCSDCAPAVAVAWLALVSEVV